MHTAEVELGAEDLSRSLANALAFVPARAIFPWVRLEIVFDLISFAGGDLWTYGEDTFKHPSPYPEHMVNALILRKDAVELESFARKNKGTVRDPQTGTFTLAGPGPSGDFHLTYTFPQGESFSALAYGLDTLESKPIETPDGLIPFRADSYFANCDALMEKLEQRETWEQGRALMIAPDLLARFGKVNLHEEVKKGRRTDGELVTADFYIIGPEDPILIKIGPNFQGMIQPVTRELGRDDTKW